MLKVKRALISVSDKKGLVSFARGLHDLGIEIISTGGTATQIKKAGIPVVEVSDYTGFPEMMDGRVKTLHPKVHGGLLAVRENAKHMESAKKHNIGMIDMAIVNLYPFESVTSKKKVDLQEAIENIDIGGPAMLRSAAKNYKNVAVLCNPEHYGKVLEELKTNSGLLADSILFTLSIEAFKHTARYDRIISEFLSSRLKADDLTDYPDEISFRFAKVQDLRYGENPHQTAAFYRDFDRPSGLSAIRQRHGKELSYNNILDLNAAIEFVKDFKEPAAVIIKHGNPTGFAEDTQLFKSYKNAWQCDPISAFGGIIGLNRKVDKKTADAILASGFMECIIATGFEAAAFRLLSKKKNIRLIELNMATIAKGTFDSKRVHGGLLLQQRDEIEEKFKSFKVVTKKKPTAEQIKAMTFGWKVIRNVKSNAILLVKGTKVVGIGCGQTSRVDSVKIAIERAGKSAKGSVLVSDAFFPKTDNIEIAAKAGISSIIQTGGSIADKDVIKEADNHKLSMVMTGVRHFKH